MLFSAIIIEGLLGPLQLYIEGNTVQGLILCGKGLGNNMNAV